MTLAQASSYFDRIQVTDPFTGAPLFMAQVDPYDDTKRDAYAAYRRILSVAPGTKMPVHRSLRLLGMDWIIGSSEFDGMKDLHRQKYVLSQAPATLKVSTLAQYLSAESKATVKAAPYWNKDAKQIDTSSDQPQMFDVFVPLEVVDPRDVLWGDAGGFLCLSPRKLASGLMSAYSLKLDHGVELATVTARVYDPVAGSYVMGSSVQVNALRVRWQSLFDYDSDAESRYRPGDLSVVVPSSPTVTTSSVLVFIDATYQVLSVEGIGGAQVAHCRKV